ncbi:MAG TPA: tol-pal system-associated acyl-CoA thioesterase [Rudaea sp.]
MSADRNAASGPSRSASTAPDSVFSWPVRVYWEDTDAGGVVYHASYLRFLERARTEWLRSHGLDQSDVRRRHNVVFVLRDIELSFLKPARLDDELLATVVTVERRSASMTFSQFILRAADGDVLVRAQVRAACVSADGFEPCRIPLNLFQENPTA